jgi:hypothetical protein
VNTETTRHPAHSRPSAAMSSQMYEDPRPGGCTDRDVRWSDELRRALRCRQAVTLDNKMARRMKRRGNCPPGVGVHGPLAEGFERASASRVTRDAGVGKGLEAGCRYLDVSTKRPNLWLGMEFSNGRSQGEGGE